MLGLLEDRHAVARVGEPDGGGEAADPGADHRDPHRPSRARSAGSAKAPIAVAPAAAATGRRQNTAEANPSPIHVHA